MVEAGEVLSVFGKIGDWTAQAAAWVIRLFSEWGIEAQLLHIKFVALLINLILLYAFIKVITIPKKFLKWGIIILLIVLIASIIISMLPAT